MFMAVGRLLVGTLAEGTQIIGRAVLQALRQEVAASQLLAKQRAEVSGHVSKGTGAHAALGMTIQEALQILNLKSMEDLTSLHKNYERLFAANEKSKGGSFYLQSKVVRARETIEREIVLMHQVHMAQTQQKTSHQ